METDPAAMEMTAFNDYLWKQTMEMTAINVGRDKSQG